MRVRVRVSARVRVRARYQFKPVTIPFYVRELHIICEVRREFVTV